MSTDAENRDDDSEPARWSLPAIGAALLLVALFGVIGIAGLRGYFKSDPKAAQTEEEKKKKPDFEISPPIVQPGEPKTPIQYVKPGHWVTSDQPMRANYRDFVGRALANVTNNQNAPYAIPHTPFILRSSRPVALSKGASKLIDSTLFIPPVTGSLMLDAVLEERGLGSTFSQPGTVLSRMPSYQYYFVVLAKEQSRYGYIKSLDSVDVPFDGESDMDDTEDPLHYRVVQLDVSQTFPLSDNPLTWSSIAYILWDEVDPKSIRITPEQQQALVDWIHWGGQLLVSGPDSLDLAKGSFLESYLPATSAGSRTIGADDLAAFNKNWMISTEVTAGKPLAPAAPWSGVKLALTDAGKAAAEQAGSLWELSGGLFAERRVGRGRIVVSAMQLAERDLINWTSGFDSFFNAALLRRPSRVYLPGHFGGVTLAWDVKKRPDLEDRRLDAQLTSNLRYFARDSGVDTAYNYVELNDDMMGAANGGSYPPGYGPNGELPQAIREYRPSENVGGVGAWNDFSPMASAARESLREAAGVEVPGAGFVIVCLAAYLLALVPLNWLVFHTLGRVEWAWIAAPIIAVAGAFIVINRAQLDIGFVRAQTEIGLLELQGDLPRAHASRYTALYTSLSTTYDLEYENLTTLAAPFPRQVNDAAYSLQRNSPVDFQRYDNVRLSGVPIASNSTGYVHSEQMLPLDGAICIGRSQAGGGEQIENRSKLQLDSVAVLRRVDAKTIKGAWIGQLTPGRSIALALPTLSLEENEVPFEANRFEESRRFSGRLNLEPMFRLALDPQLIDIGETRLVARVDTILPGQQIAPTAAQVRGATLVVAHLDYGKFDAPSPDSNTKQDIKIKTENDNSIPIFTDPTSDATP